MIAEFILSILMLMQGSDIDESTATIHGLRTPSAAISDWESFLRANVSPGDYIFTAGVRTMLCNEIKRALRTISFLLPAIINMEGERCEISLTSQYMKAMCRREFLETVLRVVSTSHDQPLLRKWINTGIYMGAESAWDLYITRLAKCLSYSVEIRQNLDYASLSPVATGRHFGSMLVGVVDIGSFMLGPVPICA